MACCVVDSEDEDNWLWFLETLKPLLGERRLTICSDRGKGLLGAVDKVFPDAYHSYCLWHLKNNLNKALGGKRRSKADIVGIFESCAYAATHAEFQRLYSELLTAGGSQVAKFIDKVPVELWANAYFPGQRYGELYSNVAESYNAWILEQRHLPITAMLDQIRIKMMDLMSERREKSRTWKGFLGPKMEKKLGGLVEKGRTWVLHKASDFHFEVQCNPSHFVDLKNRRCSCNVWLIDGFPCAHAIACILSLGQDVYRYIDEYFSTDFYRSSYSHAIEPIQNVDKPKEIFGDDIVLPPKTKKSAGRPKKKRVDNSGARPRKKQKCSRCKSYVHHNRKTCDAVID